MISMLMLEMQKGFPPQNQAYETCTCRFTIPRAEELVDIIIFNSFYYYDHIFIQFYAHYHSFKDVEINNYIPFSVL